MKNKKIAGLIGGCIVIAVAALVILVLQNSTDFDPDAMASDQDLMENQMVFDDVEEDTTVEEDGPGDSNVWEQDDSQEDKLTPEDMPDAQHLFAREQEQPKGAVAAAPPQDMEEPADENGDADSSQIPDIVLTTDENRGSGNKVVIASDDIKAGDKAGNQTGNETGSGTDGQGETESSSVDDASTKRGQDSTTEEETTDGDFSPEETTTQAVESEQSGQTEQPTEEQHGQQAMELEMTTAVTEEVVDNTPEFPDDLYWGDTPEFPEDGITDADETKTYSLTIVTTDSPFLSEDGTPLSKIYKNEQLNDWKLLCAGYYYVYDGTTSYRLTKFDDCFRIGEYPETAVANEGDDILNITFYFRPNKNSEWISETAAFTIYPQKLILKGVEGTENIEKYPESTDNGVVSLSGLFCKVIPDSYKEAFGDWYINYNLSRIFPGWSETADGEPVGMTYEMQPDATRTVLYALPLQEVPDGFAVTQYFDMQTLNAVPATGDALVIPDGIEWVDLSDTVAYQTITIPYSVTYIMDVSSLQASKAYYVDEKNENYTAVDGVLLSKDGSTVEAIPTARTTVTFADTVTQVNLTEENSLQTLTFTSATPPSISDLSMLHGASIYVPEAYAVEYYAAWSDSLGDNVINPDENGVGLKLVNDNGFIMSEDRTILYKIENSVLGLCKIPETVTTIASGAMKDNTTVRTVVLPAKLAVIEEQALNGTILTDVLSEGDTPPQIANDSFGSQVQVHVLSEDLESYRTMWQDALGEDTDSVIVSTQIYHDGDWYWRVHEDTGVLLATPKNITQLTEADLPENVVFTTLGEYAVAGCSQLSMVILPETVDKIGEGAFADCKKLECLVSLSEDTMTIDTDVFSGCSALRSIVLNAVHIEVTDYFSRAPYYVTDSATGTLPYNIYNNWQLFIVEQQKNGGYLIYGAEKLEADEDDEEKDADEYQYSVICATTDIHGEVTLLDHTTYVAASAFQDCTQFTGFNQASTSWLEYIDDYAFYNCTALESMTISSESFWYIGSYAFCYCSSLSVVDLTETSVQKIRSLAFAGTALEELTLPGTIEELGSYMFEDCSQFKTLYLEGDTAPMLVSFSYGFAYEFGSDTMQVVLQKDGAGMEQDYVDKWKYWILGYDITDDVDEETLETSAALVWSLFGMEG